MFITLTEAETGTPLALNVAHIRSITPAKSGDGSVVAAPVGPFAGSEQVTETMDQILAMIEGREEVGT